MKMESNNPKISVVVPVYNVKAYLGRCVDSILDQTWDNLEISYGEIRKNPRVP